MNKFDIIHDYCKDMYYLAVERRTQIRNRINIIAGFGLSIVIFVLTKLFEKFDVFNEISTFQLLIIIVFVLSFLTFIVIYLASYGYSKINLVDSEDVRLMIKDISYDKNLSILYDQLYDYYEDVNYDNSAIQAESDIVNHYLSIVYSENTKLIEEKNTLLSKNLLCLCIAILVNIIILISFIGVI